MYREKVEKVLRSDVREAIESIIKDATGVDTTKGPFESIEVTVGGLRSAFELTYTLGAGRSRSLDKNKGIKLDALLLYRFGIDLSMECNTDVKITTLWDIITALDSVYREGLKTYAEFML